MAVFFASTYVKLQDAYVSESNMIGGWKKIGYVMNAATNFTYAGDTENGTVAVTVGKTDAWNATSNVALHNRRKVAVGCCRCCQWK